VRLLAQRNLLQKQHDQQGGCGDRRGGQEGATPAVAVPISRRSTEFWIASMSTWVTMPMPDPDRSATVVMIFGTAPPYPTIFMSPVTVTASHGAALLRRCRRAEDGAELGAQDLPLAALAISGRWLIVDLSYVNPDEPTVW
jgi:hypothetical protein